ncbi:MAG: hypothetical protein COA78_20000 [Blastopirellula sp.]|nr:MAG: hypothetical protein COA78_20000 [Blastopirellula sp.]
MPEAQWFYAEGDIRKGPFSVAELKSIAQSGKVTPESLIWRSGFEEWVTAARVKGLFPEDNASEDKQSSESEPATDVEPGEASSDSPTESTPTHDHWPVSPKRTAPKFSSLLIAKATVAIGLVLIIFSRGCDSLEQRYAESLSGQLELLKADFDATWETKRELLTLRRDELQANRQRSASENTELQSSISDLQKIGQQEQQAKTVQQREAWTPLQKTASRVSASRKVHGFYTEILFLLSAMILCTGLIFVSMVGEGHQRWVTLLLLGIILFKFLIMT